jgi:hypothetical protein
MKEYRRVKVKLHSNYFIEYYGFMIYIRDFITTMASNGLTIMH